MEDTTTKPKEAHSDYTQRKGFFGVGKFKWSVYPDYWKESWGQRPLLGHVFADTAFYARREAYTKGLLTVNYTFGPEVIRLPPQRPRISTTSIKE